ncbi:ABC transporter permease [Mesorhizobium sp. 113-1-2]|uniref:ABC transporter permease n=1 Tax=Mesorhizobium sp. 113-1-2 TaxID=2744515 RepID=UPI00192969DE|nr:ABC transporter permease subunit [Mesorhizobium sp. 113-1-2]BCG76165.1 ABC transporter permease [Mesorhizobium sp. 113-1-2]
MRKTPPILLLLPVIAFLVTFLGLPVLIILHESIRTFEPGRIGTVDGAALTIDNYVALLHPAYARYFFDTYFLAFCAALLGILFAFPIAYHVARNASPKTRKIAVTGLVGLLFWSSLVRVYSIQLSFGSVGIVAPILTYFHINTNGKAYLDVIVIAGLLQYTIPISALMLIGSVQSLNPRLTEAALSLGASKAMAHLTVTIPLCTRGLLAALLVSLALGASAFVVPLVLGRGRVIFISNLVYSRFSEMANFPSGAAIAIVMLVCSMLLVFVISRLGSLLDRT